MRISDWSSDVCSSDLHEVREIQRVDERLSDIGIGLSGQRRQPCLDRVHALADRREAESIHDPLDLPDLILDPAAIGVGHRDRRGQIAERDMRSEEHTSELQSLMRISYAVFCLKKKKIKHPSHINTEKSTDNMYDSLRYNI